MQVPRLGDAVGGVGEGDARGGRGVPAQAELAREQVGADEAQRPGPQEQEVVADERGDRARAEERRRAVAEQRVGEGEAERVGVEGVGVEQVRGSCSIACPTHAISQAVRTGSPRSGAMWVDMCRTSGQLVSTASSDAGEDRPQQLRAPDRGRGGPPSLAPLDGGGRGAVNQRARHSPGSIREASAARRSRGRCPSRRTAASAGPCRRLDLRHTGACGSWWWGQEASGRRSRRSRSDAPSSRRS